MLMNQAFSMSKMPFEKKCKLRIAAGAIIACVGVAAFLLANVFNFDSTHDLMQGFYTGTGGGLFGAGIATIFMQLRYLKNSELRKKQERKESDERNTFVDARATQFAFYTCIFGLYLAVVVTGLFYPAAASVMLAVLVAMFLVWLISYFICNKLY